MGAGLERGAADGVIVEAIPFLKGVGGMLAVGVVPVKHLLLEVDAYALAVLANRLFRVVEHVISVDHDEVLLVGDSLLDEVVKETYELLVSSLIRHELVEASHLIQRRHRAAIVRRDSPSGMADQERPLELLQHFEWQNTGVTRFLASTERWRNRRRLSIRRHEIVGHVFNEDALAL